MCLELLQRHWSRPGLAIFGKSGERQFGIDLLDVSGESQIYAAQCKLKEPHKSLSPADIQSEVDEALKFSPPLAKYAILTSAKISTTSQRKIQEINRLHRSLGRFEVELLSWEGLCELLQKYDDIRDRFYGAVAQPQFGHPGNRENVFLVPPLSTHYVPRNSLIEKVSARLITPTDPGVLRIHALHGLGGIGKDVVGNMAPLDKSVNRSLGDK